MTKQGTVYLVGAGPGDPGLMTLRGMEVLRAADVVVYDRLANDSLLACARPEAHRIYVGKESARHALSQDEINRLLADEALAGRSVCRLKGGDPFLFGRGGEEALYLQERGIPFVVVPGVSSAIAVPAYAGIPVTDRRYGSSLAIVTGHRAADKEQDSVRWDRLATAVDTLVVLMGMENLKAITDELLQAGRGGDTPAAAIRWGTTGRQETLVSTLVNLAAEVQVKGFGSPAIVVVGEVVQLRARLSWFERRPLLGLRVLVSRPPNQTSALAERLREEGAEPVVCSLTRIAPIAAEADRLCRLLEESWDWVLFASANAVRCFRAQLRAVERDWRALGRTQVGAIGAGTATALDEQGLRADFVPSRAVAEALAEELPDTTSGTRVLVPRAATGREVLVEMLRARGATVEELAVYRTVPDEAAAAQVAQLLQVGEVDIAAFTSSSAVRSLVDAIGAGPLAAVGVAAIGPATATTVRELGLTVAIEATEHTITGLVDALIRSLAPS